MPDNNASLSTTSSAEPISAIIYGIGAVGQLIATLMVQNGIRIVGAIGHKNNIGRDLSEVIGLVDPLGVTINADAEQVLSTTSANIVVLAVGDSMESSLPNLERCLRHGCNVLSLCEQLFYPWRQTPELSAYIDTLAKQHQVTVTAGGMQDIYWVNLPAIISAASSRITAIEGISMVNGDLFGAAVVQNCFIGEPAATFQAQALQQNAQPNVFTIALQALAADLGLEVTGCTQSVRPIIATSAVMSGSIGRTIQPGEVQGIINGSRLTTREGIVLTGEVHLKIFATADSDVTQWKIKGEPNVEVRCPDTGGYVATGATILNRLLDVIDAPPGLVTIDRLSKPTFKVRF